MIVLMWLLIIMVCIAIFILGLSWGINWSVHIVMVKDHCNNYGWGNFKQFKENFYKYDLKNDRGWKDSFFNYNNNSECHADIIEFNGNGMILYPIDYLRYKLFIINISKKRHKKIVW